MNPTQLFSLPSSFDSYIRHGWYLVPIPHGTKGPKNPNWNHKENCLTNSAAIPSNHGVGLAHAYSGTMALDIDEWDTAATLLAEHCIDLQALFDAPDAVHIVSGNKGHGKLLYAMPFGAVLPSKKVNHNGTTAYELRCGTQTGLTVQDVLPPSVHPLTQRPYTWGGKGKWENLPTIPDSVLALWSSLLDADTAQELMLSPKTADQVHWSEVKSALYAIPANCSRDEWVQIGMAIHSAGMLTDTEQSAFQIWYDWSASGGEKFKGLSDLTHQWHSFKERPDGITLGTLFHIAQQHGWVQPRPDVAHLFKDATTTTVDDFLKGLQQPVPKANLDFFPEVLRQRALEVSVSTGCDPLLPLWAGMAVASGAMDKRSRLRIVDDFEVPPVIWVMCVGDPSEMKSPGTSPMFSPLHKLEAEDKPRYERSTLLWEAQEAAYSASKASYLKAAADPDWLLTDSDPDALPAVAPKPPLPPSRLRMTVDDITSQKLARMAGDQQRGLMVHLDEMASWVGKICNPNSGDDRSTWVKGFDASSHSVDRVGLEAPIRIDSFAFAFFGNIQPTVYQKGVKLLQEDGLLQRFIPIPLKRSTKLSEPIPAFLQNIDAWETAIRKIYELPISTYTLDSEAYRLFRDFQAWHIKNKEDEYLLRSPDMFMQAYGKLTGLVNRIAFILHILTSPENKSIPAYTMQNAITIVRSYVIPSYRYMTSNSSDVSSLELDMMRLIVQWAPEKEYVKPVDFQRAMRTRFGSESMERIRPALEVAAIALEDAKYIARVPGTERHTLTWAINPIIKTEASFNHLRQRVTRAKQARIDDVHTLVNDNLNSEGRAPIRRPIVIGASPDSPTMPQRFASDGLEPLKFGNL